MSKKLAIATVCWLVAIVAAKVGFAVCDDVGASGSVGACYTPGPTQYLCTGLLDEDACVDDGNVLDQLFIKEDFPTACTTQTGKNCNQPLENCYQKVDCIWEAGKCKTKAGMYPWHSATKRTTVDCPKKS